MFCQAVENGEVKKKGKASVEYLDNKGNPVYYCYGYLSLETEELIQSCLNCRRNVIYAQEDLDCKKALDKLVF